MQKKGLSHIEAILAFVLFISSIIAILYFFNFPKEKSNASANLDNLYSEIKDNLSSNLLIYGVQLDNNMGTNFTIKLDKDITGYGVQVKDYLGKEINATIVDNSTGTICLKSKNGIDKISNFTRIYLSPYVNENLVIGGCTANGESRYNITSNDERELISESKANELKKAYDHNYSAIESYFNIPRGQNFGFILHINNSYSITAQSTTANGLEIYTRDYKLNLINNSMGNIVPVNLKIITW